MGINLLLRKFTILLSILLSMTAAMAFPEGSKELYIGTHEVWLFSCNDAVGQCNNGGPRTRFASYDGPENDRLYFIKLNSTETIYLGFNGSINTPNNNNAHIVFRIKNLAGTIVYPETSLPTTGTGYIPSINEARVGPNQIYVSGGYTAINFHPADTGIFYIEWTRKLNSNGNIDLGGIAMDLIDVTVYDTVASLVKPGRLYSKSWQFQENNNCSGKTYVYSVDSIITSCQFDNMQGGIWVQFCNQWGCANTGNFTLDRKSKNTQSLLPQFRIFVNNPDPVLFPPAVTLGQIVPPDPYGIQDCNTGNIVFHVNVDKPGNVAITLDFSGIYVTRILNQNVVVGQNTITWDGLDGTLPTGVPVPNGVNVTFTVQYINGLTNLPFYDVEKNPNGFTIAMVNPPGSAPFVFWDDTGVGGGSNLTGCQSPPGCHTWAGFGQGFGNLKTINTWWYNVSATTVPITIEEWRKPGTLVFNQSPPQTYCAGASGIVFSVSTDLNTSQYHWGFTGAGAVITQLLPSDPFISVNFTVPTTGNITVYGSNTNCIDPSASVSLPVTINPIPTADAVPNQILCHNASTVAVNFSGTVPGTVYTWFNSNTTIGLAPSGAGNIASFVAINSTSAPITAMITVTPAYTAAGVTCTGTPVPFTITVNPMPTVNNIPNQGVCHGAATAAVTFTGFVPGTIFTWANDNASIGLTGTGTGDIASFTATNTTSAPVLANITVTPEYANGGVTCTGSPITFKINVYPIPTVDAVANQTLCNAAPSAMVTFSGNVAGTVYTWMNSDITIGLAGTGSGDIASFTATNSTNAPVTATITVTPEFSNSGNTCTGTFTSFTITVNPTPSVICAPTQTICSGNTTLATTLSSDVASGVSYTWTASAVPPSLYGFSASGATLTAIPAETIYNPDIIQGSVTYTVTAHFASCPGTSNTHVVLVNPSPTVTPSPITQNTCSANQMSQQISFTANVSPTTYTWAVDQVTGLLPGYLTGGTTDFIPAQTLMLSGPAQGSIRYIITPSSQIGLSCPGSPNYATIVVNPLPTPVISGAILTCELGPNVTYTTPNIAGHSYLWTITGGTITSAANLNQITVQWGSYLGSPGTLTVTETIDASLCVVTSPTYNVTLQQRPVPTLTGPVTVCNTSFGNLYTTESSMFQYNWQISGGTITSGGTPGSSTATVTWTTPGAGFIEVNYINALGCPGYPAKNLAVQVNPLPVTTITSAAGPDCNLQTHVYQTPFDLACTYTWSASSGNVVAGQGSNSATISWLSPGPAVVSVTGTYAGTTGCTTSSTLPTTVYPSPTPAFTACFDLVTTQNAKPIQLKGGLPLGGQYQGSPAISFDILTGKYWFNPGSPMVMPGIHPITYHSQNSFGCANTSPPVSITLLPSNATFTCNTTFTDPRDGKQYQTALLASQCWMKENLRYSAPSPYTSTAFATPQTDNCTFERYCLAGDPGCNSYGAVYQWSEMMQYNEDFVTTRQGFCPPGWHVPTSAEWQNLIDASQGPGIAGGLLKDMGTVQAFHALLGGVVYLNSLWSFTASDTPNATLYWTSTLANSKPVARGLNIFNPSVSLYESSRANAFPVRCVKD